VVAVRLFGRRARRAAREAAVLADWAEFREAMMRDLTESVTVAQAAQLTGRAKSTVHGWMADGKVHRSDGGGKGKLAQLPLIQVLRAEHKMRGRGRPPSVRRA
jgi:hypothetical protein